MHPPDLHPAKRRIGGANTVLYASRRAYTRGKKQVVYVRETPFFPKSGPLDFNLLKL